MGRASVAAIALVAAAIVGGCGDDDGPDATSTTATSAPVDSTTTTTEAPTTTGAPSTTPSTAAPEPPAPVTVVTAGPGGGSGEVSLRWEAVPGAQGYRVLRGAEVVAEIDVTTGNGTAIGSVTNVWTTHFSYVPGGRPFPGPDPSTSFELIEVGSGELCYTVVAFDGHAAAAPSPRVCGSPP